MANSKIKQILVGTTTYDIEDAGAAHLSASNIFTGMENTFGSVLCSFLTVGNDSPGPGNDSQNITLDGSAQNISSGTLSLILGSPSSGTFRYKFPCKKTVDEAPANIVTENENNTFTGTNTFSSGNTKFTTPAAAEHDPHVKVDASGICCYAGANSDPAVDAFTSYHYDHITYRVDAGVANICTLALPSNSGTIALTSDIPIKTATLSGTTLSITLS